MLDPATIIAGLTAAGGAASYLLTQSNKLSRVEQKLDDHIEDEKRQFAAWNERFAEIDSKLPNGELHEALELLRGMAKK
jgi:hypothetical protein